MTEKQSEKSQYFCHIHDKVNRTSIDEIRANVCVNDEALAEFEGKYFCLFHLPNKDKSVDKFNRIFRARFNALEEKTSKTETESPQNNEKSRNPFDFRYVWFPIDVDFSERVFSSVVKFDFSTFSKSAIFDDAVFFESVSFHSVIFCESVRFSNVNFKNAVWFDSSKFNGQTFFWSATFSQVSFTAATFAKYVFFIDAKFTTIADFTLTTFIDTADFRSAKFAGDVQFEATKFVTSAAFDSSLFLEKANFIDTYFFKYAGFSRAKFEESSEILFLEAKFCGKSNFEKTNFAGYVSFKARNGCDVFLDEKAVLQVRKQNKFITAELVENQQSVLDFQDAMIENPERLLFHGVRLRPSWFANVDSRKFTFFNLNWENYKGKLNEIEAEINGLKERNLIQPSKILVIACRQLAENAENNSRFEEASNFRRMAFETEWLEKKETISNWIKNLVPESEKLKRRFGGSTNEENKPIPPTNSFGILRRSGDFFIHGLYRITSFYGESWSWALGVLLSLILVIFPIIYTQINFQSCSKDRPIAVSLSVCESKDEEVRKNCTCSTDQITFSDAIVQSLTTATLQNVEYRKPLTFWGELWIILEKIFAPLQAALLALAIRRKFMR